MKKVILYAILFMGILLTSCSDDDFVNIVSVNSFGEKFCRNDIVKVFVSAEVSDTKNVSYHWECDGGELTNPQGLFENLWVAPNVAGTYEVWCTVKCGNEQQTQRSKMIVTDELFYSNFETPYYSTGYSNSSMTVAFDSSKGDNGAVKLTSSSSEGRFARSWTAFAVPFSTQYDYAVNTCAADANFVETRIEFSRVNSAMNYVTQACFTTYPRTGKWEASYTTNDVYYGETAKVVFASGTDASLFKFTKDAFNTIAVSIDNNKNFIVYYNGVKFLENNALLGVQDAYLVSRSGIGIDNKVVIFADNLYVFDNGTICTAEVRVR